VDTTDWLIAATAAGPVAGALLSPFTGAAVLQLARARARRVQHVAASGADLMRNGVPLTEEQFRDAWAVMQAELDELPSPAERNEWQLKRSYDTINRFSMLTGTFPQAFPMLGDVDSGWAWYAESNRYVTGAAPENPRTLRMLAPRLRHRLTARDSHPARPGKRAFPAGGSDAPASAADTDK
jgi:hypothetical protein